MKLNKTDYVLERASDGGYYAWLTVNMLMESLLMRLFGNWENQ